MKEPKEPKEPAQNSALSSLAQEQTCATCFSSLQFVQPLGQLIMRHPMWGCTCKDSPKYGFWLTALASCELYERDQRKVHELEPARIVKPPSGVFKRLRKK